MKKMIQRGAEFVSRLVVVLVVLSAVMGCTLPKKFSIKAHLEEKKRAQAEAREAIHSVAAQTHFSYALHLAQAGKREAAIAEMKLAIAADPQSAYLQEVLAYLLLENGDLEEALKWIQSAIKLAPERASAYNVLGLILLEMEKPEAAEQAFRTALAKAPDEAEYAINLADSLIRQNKPREALQVLQDFSKAHPNEPEPLFFVGVILQAMGHEEEAAQAFRQVLVINPWFYPAVYKLFLLESRRGNYAAAIEYGRKWLEWFPDDEKTRLQLVQVMEMAGEDEQALEVLEEGKTQPPPDPMWWLEKGFLLLRLMRFEEAREEFEAALSLEPENVVAVFGLGLVEFYLGHYVEAASYFASVPTDSPVYFTAQVQLSELMLVQGQVEPAIRNMEKLYRQRPNLEVIVAFASVLRNAEKYERARELLESALAKKPNQEDLLYELGLLSTAEGRPEEAVAIMEKILKRNAKSARAMNFIAYTWAEQGVRLNEALELAQRALKLEPGAGYIMDTVGWVYFQQNLYSQAEEWLKKALRSAGPDWEILEHLGDCQLKLKKKDKALDYYRRALSICPSLKSQRRIQKKVEILK